jgi:hypothetical protein
MHVSMCACGDMYNRFAPAGTDLNPARLARQAHVEGTVQ